MLLLLKIFRTQQLLAFQLVAVRVQDKCHCSSSSSSSSDQSNNRPAALFFPQPLQMLFCPNTRPWLAITQEIFIFLAALQAIYFVSFYFHYYSPVFLAFVVMLASTICWLCVACGFDLFVRANKDDTLYANSATMAGQ